PLLHVRDMSHGRFGQAWKGAPRRASVFAAIAIGAQLLVGCDGNIGRSELETDEANASVLTTSLCGFTAEPGASPIRRMTRFEYNNTVRDLLGDTTAPATKFPAEEE